MAALRILLATLLLSVGASAQSIRVAAAISLREALEEIAPAYQSATHHQVEFIYGSSGQLMMQIENGADIDVFISAANTQLDQLSAKDLIVPDSRRLLAGNELVLIVPVDAKNPPAGIESLGTASVKKLAIGEPATVPAGQYAMQVLNHLGLADKLNGRIVYGANVRQVLSYVERGEVSAGIVYSTDARQSGDKVKVIAAASPGLHEPIVYPAGVVKGGRNREIARQFLDYLSSDDHARAILKEKGFSLVAEPTSKPLR